MSRLWAAVLVGWLGVSSAVAQEINGYVKELGAVSVDNSFGNPTFLNILHNRLESRWALASTIRLQADLRTRLISTSDGHDFRSNVDRLQLSWQEGPWEAHVGRQRINWGKTMVWNPNDLFNAYAFLDFDYEERPGSDAVVAQYGWGYASSVEAGVSRDVVAGMFRGNVGTYDVQLLTGYYKDQMVFGGGWSGYVGSSGFKGEMSYFSGQKTLSAVVGADHMLASGVFVNGEILYNGGFGMGDAGGIASPPSPENLFMAPSAYMLGAGSAVHPLFSVNVAVLGAFTRDLTILMPQATYSIAENLDLLVLAQILRAYESNSLFLRVKWSF
jgi:hypothetical protein